MNKAAKGVAAPADIQAAVRALVDDVGEAEAASRLEMSLQTLARVAAGFRVNRSTIGMARLGLRAMGVASAAPTPRSSTAAPAARRAPATPGAVAQAYDRTKQGRGDLLRELTLERDEG
jgi:hypothetical protein